MNKLTSLPLARAFKLPEDLHRGTKAYDLMAALPLVVLLGVGIVNQARSVHTELGQIDFTHPKLIVAVAVISNIGNIVLSCLFVGLLFARRPAIAGVKGLWPRAVAILGTYLSIGILQAPQPPVSPEVLVFSTALEVGGMVFAIYSVAWLGRSLSMLAEARKLVTGGPYSFVRHPLYLGEEIALIGVTLRYLSPLTVIILLLQIGCQLYRMNFEEGILEESFPDYSDYKQRVWRLIPGIY